jgi:hypothetical protein
MPPRRAPEEQMQQMMEAQAQLMHVMTQFLANANNNNNNNNPPPPPPPPQVDMLARFLRLRPAKFSRAAEPLEAMDCDTDQRDPKGVWPNLSRRSNKQQDTKENSI